MENSKDARREEWYLNSLYQTALGQNRKMSVWAAHQLCKNVEIGRGEKDIGKNSSEAGFHRIKGDAAAVKWNTLYGSLDVYMFDDLAGVLFMDFAWLPCWTFGGHNAGITKWKRDIKNYFVERYKRIKKWVSWCSIHGLCLLAFLDIFFWGGAYNAGIKNEIEIQKN